MPQQLLSIQVMLCLLEQMHILMEIVRYLKHSKKMMLFRIFYSENFLVSQEYFDYDYHQIDGEKFEIYWFKVVMYSFQNNHWNFLSDIPMVDCKKCFMFPISSVLFITKDGKE